MLGVQTELRAQGDRRASDYGRLGVDGGGGHEFYLDRFRPNEKAKIMPFHGVANDVLQVVDIRLTLTRRACRAVLSDVAASHGREHCDL